MVINIDKNNYIELNDIPVVTIWENHKPVNLKRMCVYSISLGKKDFPVRFPHGSDIHYKSEIKYE